MFSENIRWKSPPSHLSALPWINTHAHCHDPWRKCPLYREKKAVWNGRLIYRHILHQTLNFSQMWDRIRLVIQDEEEKCVCVCVGEPYADCALTLVVGERLRVHTELLWIEQNAENTFRVIRPRSLCVFVRGLKEMFGSLIGCVSHSEVKWGLRIASGGTYNLPVK